MREVFTLITEAKNKLIGKKLMYLDFHRDPEQVSEYRGNRIVAIGLGTDEDGDPVLRLVLENGLTVQAWDNEEIELEDE